MKLASLWLGASAFLARKSAPSMRELTSAIIKSKAKDVVPIVMVRYTVPKQSMSDPFAAFNLVSLGPLSRC